jgi:hypothetical protein
MPLNLSFVYLAQICFLCLNNDMPQNSDNWICAGFSMPLVLVSTLNLSSWKLM